MKLKRIIASFACMGLFVSLFSAFNPIAADAAVKSIKLSNKKLSMTVGEKKVLKVKYKPAKSKAKIVWSSSKKKVAKVSKKGKVTAKSEGSAVITAKIKASKIKAACKVKVSNAVDVTPTNVSVPSPTPTTPAATLAPTNVVDNKVYPTEIKLLPPNGVYASRILIDGVWYYGVTNLGTKPTISDGYEVSVETNVFDFDKDVYGNRVEVALYHFLRQEMKFENVEALKKQMESDASFAKEMFLIQ